MYAYDLTRLENCLFNIVKKSAILNTTVIHVIKLSPILLRPTANITLINFTVHFVDIQIKLFYI